MRFPPAIGEVLGAVDLIRASLVFYGEYPLRGSQHHKAHSVTVGIVDEARFRSLCLCVFEVVAIQEFSYKRHSKVKQNHSFCRPE